MTPLARQARLLVPGLLLAGLLLAGLQTGCGGARSSTSSVDGMSSIDLASADDLTTAGDLAKYTGPLGCAGYVQCLSTCSASASCASACKARLTMAGQQAFDEAVGCGQAFCIDSSTVPARCVLDNKMVALVDPPSTPTGTCNACLANAVAAVFSATCDPANSPDCNPSACAPTVTACKASTP